MRSTANLSLEQAPPISVPFRFFLTAPLFGMLGGAMLVIYGPDLLLSRWSPPTLGLTHLLTLGVLALVMCGAMMQMLPVLAGSPVPKATAVAWLAHPLLSTGTLALVFGLAGGSATGLTLSALLLGGGFLIFLVAVTIALLRVQVPNPTVSGMRGAVAALAVTLTLGVVLVAGVGGAIALPIAEITNSHLAWGLLGWVGLLLVAVSYQVVPMFQITPEYPRWMQRGLVSGALLLLLGWSLLQFWTTRNGLTLGLVEIGMDLAALGYLLFAGITLRLQHQRTRRIVDASLLFWRLGLIVLIASGALWLTSRFFVLGASPRVEILIGLGVIYGGAISLMNGMLYKIVPFLSWFHLQNRQMKLMCLTVQIPNMKELISEQAARRQFYLHGAALAALAGAIFLPLLARPAGLLMLGSFALLGWNLTRAVLHYRAVNSRLLAAASAG